MPSTRPPDASDLTRAALFVVAMVNAGQENAAAVRALCEKVAGLVRFRDLQGQLSCKIAFGSDAWDCLLGVEAPDISTISETILRGGTPFP